jgi:hypothetical protein
VHKRIISAVKRVEFVSDRMSYIILRGRWCHIIVTRSNREATHSPSKITDLKRTWIILPFPHTFLWRSA